MILQRVNGEACTRVEHDFVRPNIDAMIAAVAVVNGATLVTRNVKHFGFEELDVVQRC